MNTLRKLALASLAGAGLLASAPIVLAEDSSEPIKIITNNWTSQLVLSNVVGQLLQSKGYNVEYVSSDTQLQYTALANGDMDLQLEVWEGSQAESFDKAVAAGALDLGAHEAVTREDWWYPTYVKEVCPGLPDWKALDACAEKFATAESGSKGRFVGPPADWGKHYSERIQALNMNFQEVAVGQAATLWAELQAAYDRKEPIGTLQLDAEFHRGEVRGRVRGVPDLRPGLPHGPEMGLQPGGGLRLRRASEWLSEEGRLQAIGREMAGRDRDPQEGQLHQRPDRGGGQDGRCRRHDAGRRGQEVDRGERDQLESLVQLIRR